MTDEPRPLARGPEPLSIFAKARRGKCSICGSFGQLTDAHVPPASLGNRGPFSFVMATTHDDGTRSFVNGRPTLGGSRLRAQCAVCNTGVVARYDLEWVVFRDQILAALDTVSRRVPGSGFPTVVHARPGSFVRSVLAGMLAINPLLRNAQPGLAAAVHSGVPARVPNDVELLLSLHNGWFGISGGGAGRSDSTRRHSAQTHA